MEPPFEKVTQSFIHPLFHLPTRTSTNPSIFLCVYLSICPHHLSNQPHIHPPTHSLIQPDPSIHHPSTHTSINQSTLTHPPIHPHAPISPCTHQSIHISSIHPPVHSFIHPSAQPPIHEPIHPSIERPTYPIINFWFPESTSC